MDITVIFIKNLVSLVAEYTFAIAFIHILKKSRHFGEKRIFGIWQIECGFWCYWRGRVSCLRERSTFLYLTNVHITTIKMLYVATQIDENIYCLPFLWWVWFKIATKRRPCNSIMLLNCGVSLKSDEWAHY